MTRKIWPFRRTKLRKRWLFLRTWTSWPVTWQNFEVIDKKPLCLVAAEGQPQRHIVLVNQAPCEKKRQSHVRSYFESIAQL